VALGGWVGTNYAVLACSGFPQCNGAWWPTMDARGFELLRELGRDASGAYLPFEALVAIHFAHRLFALLSAAAVGLLAWNLWRDARPTQRRYAAALVGLLGAQVATGASNVTLDWPIAAALAHSAGAAALVGVLCSLLLRSRAPGLKVDALLESRPS
jgi:cytochrome c oxidase assembly protein subunit 15